MAMENLLSIICIIMMRVHLSAGEIEIAVLAGQDTTLPCIFEGIHVPSHVTWLKGDPSPGKSFAIYVDNRIEYRNTTDKDRYRMQKNSSFSLTIADVEMTDAGWYRCAVTVNGANFLSVYHLKVLVPPELPYPRIVPMIPDSDGGQPINLTCRADRGSIGLVNLNWMNNGTIHIQQEMISYPNADGTTENVTSVIEAYPSEKPYTCVATFNTSGHESATAFVNIRPRHGSTPKPPAPTPTVTTTTTDRQNKTTIDDTGSGISLAAKLVIAFGVIFGVVIIVVALVIIAVYRKRIEEAIKQRRRQRTRNGNTSPQLSPNKDDNENEAVNETLMTTVC